MCKMEVQFLPDIAAVRIKSPRLRIKCLTWGRLAKRSLWPFFTLHPLLQLPQSFLGQMLTGNLSP